MLLCVKHLNPEVLTARACKNLIIFADSALVLHSWAVQAKYLKCKLAKKVSHCHMDIGERTHIA